MKAVHVRTYGMNRPESTEVVEEALSHVPGVAASIAVRSLDVTSVLYEPLAVTPEVIAKVIRRAGFRTEIVNDTVGERTTQQPLVV